MGNWIGTGTLLQYYHHHQQTEDYVEVPNNINDMNEDTQLNQKDRKLLKSLIEAIEKKDIDKVKDITKKRRDIVNCFYNQTTPLIKAIKCKQTECVNLLIEAGADLEQAEQKHQEPPVVIAIIEEQHEILEKILSIKKDNEKFINKRINCDERTALHYAISQGNEKAFTKLMEHPHIDVNLSDKYKYTPLHRAVEKDLKNMVYMLCLKPEINFDAINENGLTAEKTNTPHSLASKDVLKHCEKEKYTNEANTALDNGDFHRVQSLLKEKILQANLDDTVQDALNKKDMEYLKEYLRSLKGKSDEEIVKVFGGKELIPAVQYVSNPLFFITNPKKVIITDKYEKNTHNNYNRQNLQQPQKQNLQQPQQQNLQQPQPQNLQQPQPQNLQQPQPQNLQQPQPQNLQQPQPQNLQQRQQQNLQQRQQQNLQQRQQQNLQQPQPQNLQQPQQNFQPSQKQNIQPPQQQNYQHQQSHYDQQEQVEQREQLQQLDARDCPKFPLELAFQIKMDLAFKNASREKWWLEK